MKYVFNGKVLNIPDDEIKLAMKNLDCTEEEAIEMWLEDEGHIDNPEQLELCKKAKENRITATIHEAHGKKTEKKQSKPRTVKISNEKQELFKEILEILTENHEKVEILNENKLIRVEINEKVFKIDLIEQRKPKK
jgi:hypothetical protein